MLFATSEAQLLRAQASQPAPKSPGETTQDYNRRVQQLRGMTTEHLLPPAAHEYRIGPEDLLEITVFEATELNRKLRVSAAGAISLPLLGAVKAAGLTPRELEHVLQELLRRAYMKDPHVGVHVSEIGSHPVSVVGAVKKPGVFQIRGPRSLLEVLSMAEGFDQDAGETIIVMRGAAFAEPEVTPENGPPAGVGASQPGSQPEPPKGSSLEINLKLLLESGDPRYNVAIYPGDIVKVTRAGVVYVIGEVRKPGGFLLKTNEAVSVLQALALGEGLTRTAAKGRARIIRTDQQSGQRQEIPVDLGKILSGKAPDLLLQPRDIVFVPNSAARGAFYRGAEVGLATLSGVLVFRR